MPTTIVAQPSRNGWEVRKNGRKVSNHRKRKRAWQRARKEGRTSGGTVTLKRADGTISDRVSY